MAQVQYSIATGTNAPVNSTGSLQTIIAIVNAATDCGVQIKKYRLGFNGVTAANPPLMLRWFTTNNATAGTVGTTPTVTQESGRTLVSTNITGGSMYSAEPTTKTYVGESFTLTPNGGTIFYDYPSGDEPDMGISSTYGLELQAGTIVGVVAALWFTRI